MLSKWKMPNFLGIARHVISLSGWSTPQLITLCRCLPLFHCNTTSRGRGTPAESESFALMDMDWRTEELF